MRLYKQLNITLNTAAVNTLDNHQLPEGDFMDFNFENIVEMSLVLMVIILLLDTNLSVVIELHSKQQMISWLNFQVVALAKRVDHPLQPFFIFDDPAFLLA